MKYYLLICLASDQAEAQASFAALGSEFEGMFTTPLCNANLPPDTQTDAYVSAGLYPDNFPDPESVYPNIIVRELTDPDTLFGVLEGLGWKLFCEGVEGL